MEVEEIQAQACNNNNNNNNNAKFPRNKLGQKGGHDHHRCNPGDEDDLGDQIKRPNTGPIATDGGNGGNRLRGWHHSSRIIRVSRASGGKDRHSKVWTSKGLRDRRVRLSVTTAIQFYDLQDRLGYDQPSKAVEWLINAASDAIAELPSLNSSFPDTPKQLSYEKRPSIGMEQGFDSAEVVELELDQGEANYQQHLSLSKSACSSTSETSKGSGLSLSRSEVRVNRVKARERARERAAKEKEKENSDSRIPHPRPHPQNHHHHHQNINPISQNPSFTELLTAGINTVNNNSNNNNESPSPTTASDQPNLFHKSSTAMAATAAAMQMDYFTAGLLGLSSSRNHHHHHSSGFAGLPMAMSIPQPFSVVSGSTDGHAAVAVAEALPPHFSFVPEQLIATTSSQPNGNGGDYSLNFSISSSGLAGFNRGTLQSNSLPSSFLPHLQRFASPIDGTTNVPFFIGAAAAAPPMENHHHHHHNHHQFPAGFDGRLQLYYGDGSRHLDQKGKGKN